jgi:hypothetical protein
VNDVSVFCLNGKKTTTIVYMELLRWSLFSISCLLFSFNGSEFLHPNHGLKFPALDAKMAATEATFTTPSPLPPKPKLKSWGAWMDVAPSDWLHAIYISKTINYLFGQG